jgi:uncharacterized membrane protein
MRTRKKYLLAVYIIIALIGIISFILSYYTNDPFWESIYQNFFSEFLGVVIIFFLINYFLTNDEWELSSQVQKLIEQNRRNNTPSPSHIFKEEFIPHNVPDSEYENIKTIYVSGYSLSRLTRQKTHLFSTLLKKGVDIKFVILDYKNKTVINQISERTSENLTEDLWKTRLKDAHSLIKAIQKTPDSKGATELRFIPYVPGFGLLILERYDGNHDCFTIIYPHKSGHVEPAFKVNSMNDPKWYSFLKQQFDIYWESSRNE